LDFPLSAEQPTEANVCTWYEVPAALPRTSTGKVDRARLAGRGS
jgi:hypothetical protein